MLDLASKLSMEKAIKDDVALHAEMTTLAGLVERLGVQGRSIEDISIEELRAEGLSNEAIEFVIHGSPAELRSVLGATAAFMLKRGKGPG